jgi:cytochrome c-type biogenesis protein CcmH
MDGTSVAWGWPVGMLALGLVFGAALLFLVRRQAPSPLATDPVELRDLDGQLEVLIGQLRELDDLGDPERAARERFALEVRAAEVLRSREKEMPAPKRAPKAASVEAPAVAPTGFFATRPALRGFLWGTGSAAALAVLVFFVWRQAKPREEGGSLTGNLPGEEERAAAGRPADPRVPLQQRIAQNPDDLAARLDLAQLHLRQRDLMGVWNETEYVLAKQPGQPRALAYQALVRLAMGQPQVALDMLKQALATDPDLLEGYLHLALVHVRMGHVAEAEATIKRASVRFPAQAPALAKVLDEMRAVGPEEEAPPQGDPHADVDVPAAGGPSPTAAALRGVIELPDALRAKVGPEALVFVTVREAGVTQGPPVAVKRLPASSFPLEFEIGPADSMMGQPLPARARVEARVDADGNPLTRTASDPSARQDDVTPGTRLRLVLQ